MVSGRGNWSANLWLPSCRKSTTVQNLNISNYARGMKKTSDSKRVHRFHFVLDFMLFKICSFIFIFNYHSFCLSNWKCLFKFLKMKVHQKKFDSAIPLKIILEKLFFMNKHFDVALNKTRRFLTTKSTFKSCEVCFIKVFKIIIISIPI